MRMQLALGQARLAANHGEIPIGCVIFNQQGDLIASAHDQKEQTKDPCAHAEILALRRAATEIGDWRLDGCSLYVTLEPCPMCLGSLLQARISRLVYGAENRRWSLDEEMKAKILQNSDFNHQVSVESGILEKDCRELLQSTFRKYRLSK